MIRACFLRCYGVMRMHRLSMMLITVSLVLLFAGGSIWYSQSNSQLATIEDRHVSIPLTSLMEVDLSKDEVVMDQKVSDFSGLRIIEKGEAIDQLDGMEMMGTPRVIGDIPQGWMVLADSQHHIDLVESGFRVRVPQYQLVPNQVQPGRYFIEPGSQEGMQIAKVLRAEASMLRSNMRRMELILIPLREIFPARELGRYSNTQDEENGNSHRRRQTTQGNR